MRSLRFVVLSTVGIIACASFHSSTLAAESKTAASGKTQIVARLDGREITISDLRSEQARLGLSPNDVNAERIALDSIVNRALLTTAARAAKIHRRPEALRRMAMAREQALADIYITTVSQPPEPTLEEVEDFVAQNPSLFRERRIYTFSVLTMPSDAFDQERLTPLFDEANSFAALSKQLKKSNIRFSEAPLAQPSNVFPEAVRSQLAQYGVNDNIVITGEIDTQIMKIDAITPSPIPMREALALARRVVMRQSAQTRAENILASLKKKSTLTYFRATAAPVANGAEGEGR